ncbi:MAG: 50S ribosomal protein L29 [Oscillatoriaceae cyanobacterium Prado104]|jgi:large subunit ribosomal protein L29|nr:50S ribosomal protein L29 [Oscillatoriaceae cyanobacterium Prado104]
MSLPKIKEARELSDAEIAEQILAVKRQLMELRLQQATGRLEKPHQFKHAKHRLAQLMTVERERQIAADAAEVATSALSEPAVTAAE